MKKIYIVFAVVSALVLTSCLKEQSFNDHVFKEGEVAFVLKAGESTKAAETGNSERKGVSITLGDAVSLEETITDLNFASPQTKGSPVFTENVGTLYKDNLGVYSSWGEFGEATYTTEGEETVNGGWRFFHRYDNAPWPSNNAPVDFYMRMPADALTIPATGYSGGKIKFSYSSPTTGEDQKDLIFAYASVTEAQHKEKFSQGGYPVTFYHALTGVKFRNGHTNENDTKTIITKVQFSNLNDKGECTVDFSSNNKIQWPADKQSMTVGSFYQEFENATYDPDLTDLKQNPDGTVGSGEGYDADHTWNSNLIGTTWTSAEADKNLNDKDGSLTFWFIPQTITNDVTLEVTFLIKTKDTPNGTEITHKINFGKELNKGRENNVEWKAGELRTYTLKPFDVDVQIEDSMTATQKSGLHIANTGNVDEYVRVLIMGNWYGWAPGTTDAQMQSTEPSILVGYKYKGDEAIFSDETLSDAQKDALMKEMVDPWYREGYPDPNSSTGAYYDPYGSFDSTFALANLGGRDGKQNDWADASGGFYYTTKIGPGEGTIASSATKNLFNSYTVTNVPTIYLPSGDNGRAAAVGVHLVMEIVIQAIAVPTVKVNGEVKDVWWLEAWYRATGVDKLHPNALKDDGITYRNKKYRDLYKNGEYTSLNQVYDLYPIE